MLPKANKSEAIHRAVLTGLLSNVGLKTDVYEYSGPRGTRFNIHPGSALFEEKPKWIVAAELVDTNRLYARTVAPVRPQWIERAAAHLVERTYSEPHWHAESAHVHAYEKVTLHGLVLVPHRTVHYGPINPKLSREIFIQHALVLGEYRTDAGFFRHNRALERDIEALEAKIRQKNLLVDAHTRFTFYDARIPQGIFNGPLFEQWRKKAEVADPNLLFMGRSDLMRDIRDAVPPEQFPDTLHVDEMQLPLLYRYDPADAADGITLRVPLAALGQLHPARFDWLVPGQVGEKVTALLKSLPGALRKNFVPVPTFARAATAELEPSDQPLTQALATVLGKLTGVAVESASFQTAALPDYLRMNFQVIGDNGRVLATGRDLPALQRKFARESSAAIARLSHAMFNRDGLIAWTFGDLPESVDLHRHGMTLHAHPALVDAGTSVSLRLLPQAAEAATAHHAGLRRLFALALPRELEYLPRHFPRFDKAALFYYTLGTGAQLQASVLDLVVERTFLSGAAEGGLASATANIRTPAAFAARQRAGIENLLQRADEVFNLTYVILEAYHKLTVQLDEPLPPSWQGSVADIDEHLRHLLPPDFLNTTPWEQLVHYPRYLRAIALRLEKLDQHGPDKDAQRAAELVPLWQDYLQRRAQNKTQGTHDVQLDIYRWMLEEFRVAVFAQELRTPMPISARRLEKHQAVLR